MKTSTASPTTKLIKIEENSQFDEKQTSHEQILSVKSLNSTTTTTSNDVIEPISNDYNDTVEIIMTDDINATELSDFTTSERKSKGLLEGFSEEAKFVNNISSRSTLQVSHENEIIVGGDDDLSSEALFDVDEDNGGIAINAALISLICICVVGSLSAFSIMFVYVYRQRYLNKPQALSDPDSSGYIDDSSIRVSWVKPQNFWCLKCLSRVQNSGVWKWIMMWWNYTSSCQTRFKLNGTYSTFFITLISRLQDNSDELYSLDNDSFLNSLEAMTIQNYWTDSVKHTKLWGSCTKF